MEIMTQFLLTNLNTILENIIVYIAIFTIMCTMMKPRKYCWIAFILLMLKPVYSKLATGMLVENLSSGTEMILQMINALVLPILVLLLWVLAIQGDLGKIIIASIFAETVGILIQQICIILTRILLHRPELYAAAEDFRWSDLLLLLVFGIIFAPLYAFTRPVLLRYRDLKLRYAWLALILYGIQYVMVIPSYFVNYWSDVEVKTGYLLFFAVWAVFLIGLVVLYVRQLRRRTELEKEQLEQQQKLFATHYMLLRENHAAASTASENLGMQSARSAASHLNEEMETILRSREGTSNPARLKEYLESLRESRSQTQAGIYCQDWLVDAVLVNQSQMMKQQELTLECETHTYDRGAIKEEEFCRLLHALLDQVRKDARPGNVLLEMKTVANQLLVTIKWNTKQKKYRSKKLPSWARKYVEKFRGGTNNRAERGRSRADDLSGNRRRTIQLTEERNQRDTLIDFYSVNSDTPCNGKKVHLPGACGA